MILSLAAFGFCCAATVSAEDSFYTGGKYPNPRFDYVTLGRLLDENPPSKIGIGLAPSHYRGSKREAAVEAFNAHVYWEGPYSKALGDFYRARIAQALSDIETARPPRKGVLVWKLYSSGVVLKSAEGVFAFDVIEGPHPDTGEPPESAAAAYEEDLCSLYWNDDLRDQYVRAVDALFVTHYHNDHVSRLLTSKLLDAGKTVVMTEQNKRHYVELGVKDADRIMTMPQDRVNYIASREYYIPLPSVDGRRRSAETVRAITFNGFQDEYRRTEHDGGIVMTLNPDPSRAENNVYIVRIGGVNVFHNGDIHHCPSFCPWLVNLVGGPWQPDLCLTVPWYENWEPLLTKLFPKASLLIVHDLELGHTKLRPDAPDPRPLFRFGLADPRCLLWGERFHYQKPRSRTGAH